MFLKEFASKIYYLTKDKLSKKKLSFGTQIVTTHFTNNNVKYAVFTS